MLAGEKLFPMTVGGLLNKKANEERKIFLISWEILFNPTSLKMKYI